MDIFIGVLLALCVWTLMQGKRRAWWWILVIVGAILLILE